jgi:RNA polymerase sigma-70 factor (ECF subfamily)
MVLTAGDIDATGRFAALERLCETYWRPVYCYVRQCGANEDDAEDLTQEFFAKFLRKNSVMRAERERGRFRSFLLASVKNFLANERRRSKAQRRGGGDVPVPLDDAAGAGVVAPDLGTGGNEPDLAFERNWALTMLETALVQLEAEYERAGKGVLFRELRLMLWDDAEAGTYAQVGARLSMSSAAVKMAVSRLRRRARERLLREIADTVGTQEEADDEFRNLRAVLARRPGRAEGA